MAQEIRLESLGESHAKRLGMVIEESLHTAGVFSPSDWFSSNEVVVEELPIIPATVIADVVSKVPAEQIVSLEMFAFQYAMSINRKVVDWLSVAGWRQERLCGALFGVTVDVASLSESAEIRKRGLKEIVTPRFLIMMNVASHAKSWFQPIRGTDRSSICSRFENLVNGMEWASWFLYIIDSENVRFCAVDKRILAKYCLVAE